MRTTTHQSAPRVVCHQACPSKLRSVRCFSSGTKSSTTEAVVTVRTLPVNNSRCTVAESVSPAGSFISTPALPSSVPLGLAAAGGLILAGLGLKKLYDTPSRRYDENVGDEYDAWTEEGILEYYWGEHIHLGYYTEEERQKGWWRADFKAAKLRFTQEMFKWAGANNPKRVLDVGCGFGGSSRWMASQLPQAKVTGMFYQWCLRVVVGSASPVCFCDGMAAAMQKPYPTDANQSIHGRCHIAVVLSHGVVPTRHHPVT